MFSGIVTGFGEILEVDEKSDGLRRLIVACNYDPASIAVGASIACSGICLTVVGRGLRADRPFFAVDAAAETLRLTTAGSWRRGTHINLERSLRLGDEMGGHLVSGHVDGIAVKGSVALDGVSLTVNKVDGDMISVLIIPHTLQVTTFGKLEPGARLNLEVDQLARYVARLMDTLPRGG
jgi:riboflavin synthase